MGDRDVSYGNVSGYPGRSEITGLPGVQAGDLQAGPGTGATLSALSGGSWLLAGLDGSGQQDGLVNGLAMAGASSPPLIAKDRDGWLQVGGVSGGWTIVRRFNGGAEDPDFTRRVETFGGAILTGVRVREVIRQRLDDEDGGRDRIVVVGDADSPSGRRALVAAYRPDGTPDTAFSTLVTPAISTVGGAAIDGVGRLVVGGTGGAPGVSTTQLRVLRLTTSGSVDTTFGTAGVAAHTFPVDVSPARVEGVAIAAFNRPVLVGTQRYDAQTEGGFLVARLTDTGAMDPEFGLGDDDGFQRVPFWDFGDALLGTAYGLAVTVQSPSDKIIVAGNAISQDGTATNIAVARLLPTGQRDATFGTTGETFGGTGYGEAIAIQPDGRLLVGGEDDEALVAQRYEMEPVDNSEIPPPGAAISIEGGAAKVVDVADRAVDLRVGQSGSDVVFEERRDGLELVAIGGGGCTQVTAVKVTCPGAPPVQLDLGNRNDRVQVESTVAVEVEGDLGPGNDSLIASQAGGVIHAGEGDDTVTGGAARDRLFGEGGADVLTGAGGSDDLYGEGAGECDGCLPGADTLNGGAGFDRLYGGEGADSLDAGPNDDLVAPGPGADVVTAGAGYDLLSLQDAFSATRVRANGVADDGELDTDPATPGAQPEGDAIAADFEYVWGSAFDDDIEIPAFVPGQPGDSLGGDGDDRIVGTAGADHISGGAGNDELHGGDGTDTLHGSGVGGDADRAEGGDDQLFGGEGDLDTLVGGNGADVLDGGAGSNDVLFGDFESDEPGTTIDADRFVGGDGAHDHAILGRSGDQSVTLDGVPNDGRDDENDDVRADIEDVTTGSGNDTLQGDGSDETFDARGGNDVVDGAGGQDILLGGDGEDTLTGGTGPDQLRGDDGVSTLGSADALDGGLGDDIIEGDGGDDEINAGAGRDRVFAGGGDDTLRLRDDEIEQQIVCDAGLDLAIIDPADPVGADCETVQAPGGSTPTPTPTSAPTPTAATVTPGPGAPGPGTSGPGTPGTADPAPDASGARVLCPQRVDLFVRGTVALSAGEKAGFSLDVDSPLEETLIDGQLLDAATGQVLAEGAQVLSVGTQLAQLRFGLVDGARAKLASADTRVALSVSAAVATCTTVVARDELTVTRSAGGQKAQLRGHLSARAAAAPVAPRASRLAVDPEFAICIAQPAQPNWESRCKHFFEGGPGKPDPDPKCESSLPLGAVTIHGSCLKRDPKSGIYKTSAGFTLNGIGLEPVGGSEVQFDPSKLQLKARGQLRLVVAGVTLYQGDPTWSLRGGDITIAEGARSKSANIKGFPIQGNLTFDITAQGATAKVFLKLPTPKAPRGAKSAALTAKAEIKFDVIKGASLDGLDIEVPKFSVGPLDVLPVRIKYRSSTDTWSGSGEAMLPGPVKPKPKVKVTFEFQKGALKKGSFTLIDLNKPVPFGPATGVIFLQKVGAGFEFEKALKVSGTLAVSAGPKLKLGRGEPKAILLADVDASYDFEGAGTWSGTGTLQAMGEELGEAKMTYTNSGKMSFEGELDREFKAFGAGLTVKGKLKGEYANQVITAEGEAMVTAGPLSAKGTAKLNKTTVVGCLGGFPGAGGTYVLGTGELKLFEGCGNPSLTDAVKKAQEVVKQQQGKAKSSPKGKKSQAEAPAGPGEFLVGDALPHVVLAVEGQGGVPQGALVSPKGERLPAPAPGQGSQAGGRAILSDAGTSRVMYAIASPAPGVWRWEPAAGSVPLAAVLQADGVKRPAITARVTGKGAARTLEYEIETDEPGMTVRFQEEGSDVLQDLGAAQSDGRGSRRFTPADGTLGRRTIVAIIEQDGVLVDRLGVATFRAAVDGLPGRVTDLQLSRSGSDRLRVRFGGADEADGHRVVVALGDGRTELLDLDGGARSVIVDDVPRDVSATVSVQGITDAGRAGALTSARLAAGKVPSDRPAKAPVTGELGDAVVVFG